MKKKLFFIVFVCIVSTLTFITMQEKHTVFAQNTSIVTPTLYCLGSCPTLPPQRVQTSTVPSPSTTALPTQTETIPSTSPSATPSVAPTQPCESGTVSVQHMNGKKKHKKGKKGAIGNGMSQLLRFLIEFINLLLRLIGGAPLPAPTEPGQPCKPEEIPEPSDGPSPTDSAPTVQPSSGVTPSVPAPSSSANMTNCESDPGKCGYPNKSNTGVPSGITLTNYTGPLQIKTAGTVIEGKNVQGCLDIEAPGVIVRKSKITCNSYYGILTRESAANGNRLLVEDVEIACGGNTTGVAGSNIDVRRAYVHDCENGFSLDKNVTVEDSFVPNAVEVNGGHGDAMQFAAPVSNIVVRHNTLFAHNTTAAVNWTGTDQTVNMLVENNLLAGGAYTIYCPRGTVPANSFRVLNNRFGKYTYGYADSCGSSGVVFTGNYKDSDLSTIQP